MYRLISCSLCRLQVQQLGHHDVGHAVVDLGAEEDDPLGEQPGVDVEGALAVAASSRPRWGSCTGPCVSSPAIRPATGRAHVVDPLQDVVDDPVRRGPPRR